MGRVVHLGPSWHGPSFMWAELVGAELVLVRVVLHPGRIPVDCHIFLGERCEPTYAEKNRVPWAMHPDAQWGKYGNQGPTIRNVRSDD